MPPSRPGVVGGPLPRRRSLPRLADGRLASTRQTRHRPSTAQRGFRQLTEQLMSTGAGRFSGVPHTVAESFGFARLFPLLPTPWQMIYLVGTEREREVVVQGLETWYQGSERRPIMAVPPLTPALLDRLLRHEPIILVCQQAVFADSLPHPAELPNQWLILRPGPLPDPPVPDPRLRGEVEGAEVGDGPTGLTRRLVELGYTPVSSVEQAGQWAKRGEVVDLWPAGTTAAVRVVFNGGAIDRLQEWQPGQTNSGRQLTEVRCAPLDFTGVDPRISLLSYFQPMRTLIVVPRLSLLDSLPRGREAAKQYKQVLLEPFGDEGVVKLDWRAATFYHRQWTLVVKDVAHWQAAGYTIAIHTNRQAELVGLFERHGLATDGLTWLNTPALTQGFIAPSERYVYLTDEELFGRDLRAKQNRRRVEDVFLSELTTGDYVVHLDHGIGRFIGMRLQQVNGHAKEYFVLEYAGNDKLYVPVETADKINRYLGSPNPKLHSLSSSSWATVTKKIQADTSRVAHELLELYAQRELAQAPRLLPHAEAEERLADQFPYELTADQARTLQETMADLERDTPSDRLICGDVGFGKTEVAIRAAWRVVLNKRQVALLSPTTILTQQHFDTFRSRLRGLPVSIGVLSRFESKEEQQAVLAQLAAGQLDIVIGTHRLLSADVKFKTLGLIIVDEEQRFGVKHKEKLKALRTEAHVLTLTATPIPRTLNFALAGLRDISVIETPPEGRQPIETAIQPYDADLVREAIQRELHRHGQVYYVHNDVETIDAARDRLQKLVPTARFGIAHGQLDEQQLSRVMEQFDNQRLDVLVASTIIENGLDLPNVNTLIVDQASKFGLAQLYQLRGRIGRGFRQAYAYFMYRSGRVVGKPHKRLQALLEAKELGSGFRLAMRDLEIRGTGNILGKKQHGHVTAIGLNLYARLLAQAVEELRTGKPARPSRDILIDLPLAIAIPLAFVPSEPKRLRLYQRLAALETVEELHEFRQQEFKHRPLPDPLVNLLEALELKILAQDTPITSIQQTKVTLEGVTREKIVVTFEQMITPEQIGQLLKRNQAWDFTPEFVKIDRDLLGPKWLQELKQVVKIFRAVKETADGNGGPSRHERLSKPKS